MNAATKLLETIGLRKPAWDAFDVLQVWHPDSELRKWKTVTCPAQVYRMLPDSDQTYRTRCLRPNFKTEGIRHFDNSAVVKFCRDEITAKSPNEPRASDESLLKLAEMVLCSDHEAWKEEVVGQWKGRLVEERRKMGISEILLGEEAWVVEEREAERTKKVQ
jgi:hypothetical protein